MMHLEENSFDHQAEALILRDLIDALLSENLFGLLDRSIVAQEMAEARTIPSFSLTDDERYLRFLVGSNALIFRVQSDSALQHLRLSRPPVMLVSANGDPGSWHAVSPLELVRILAESLSEAERDQLPNLEGFARDLRDTLAHTTILLEAAPSIIAEITDSPQPLFVSWERLATLRDRPFHPTARAKSGWSTADYHQFGALPGAAFGLDWIAVRRDLIQSSAAAQETELPALLDQVDQQAIEDGYAAAGVSAQDYVALPVHPWQMAHVLPALYASEFEQTICVPLAHGLGQFTATSSVRSLAPVDGNPTHIKLPIGISSLGALRLLPPRYLHNGGRGQSLLEQMIGCDPVLAQQLWVCDEQSWWAFRDPNGDPFADKPGHLACMLRRYPQDLLSDPTIDLIPMSALTVATQENQVPAANHLLQARLGSRISQADILELFHEIAIQLTGVALRCFGYGAMPELHGQNAVLVVRCGQIAGILLRDHDTVRTYRPWLAQADLADPAYIVKPGTPNSLINDTPEALLAYFQTLGVQVNLYAIAETLAEAYTIDQRCFWDAIRTAIAAALNDLAQPAHSVGQSALLDSEIWPTKLVLKPLLQRIGTGGGSMPSGIGSTLNPLTWTATSLGSVTIR